MVKIFILSILLALSIAAEPVYNNTENPGTCDPRCETC